MKTLPYIEDYLEVIAGKRDAATLKVHGNALFGYGLKPIINLARYDVGFLDSVTDGTLQAQPLTDRQAELAVKIVLKYRKQLNAAGIEIDPASVPAFRKPLRLPDRTCSIGIQGNHIICKFPYNATWIQHIRDMLKTSQGGARFIKDQKVWMLDLTEYNVNWVVTWARSNNFAVSQDLDSLMQGIIEMGERPYCIRLQRTADGSYEIENAAQSLLDHIHDLGLTMQESDLAALADLGSVLGYSVDESIWQALEQQHGSDVVVFMRTRTYELHGDYGQIDRVIRYAQLVNRTPMVIFDPSPNGSLSIYQQKLGDQLSQVGNAKEIGEVTQLALWSHRAVRYPNSIPLLVSHVGMIAGAEKQLMVQNSQKIIYFNKRLT